jgi:hypothetical protein
VAEIILPRLAQCCLPDRVCESLQQDADFQRLKFQCQQTTFVKDFLDNQNHALWLDGLQDLIVSFSTPPCDFELKNQDKHKKA